MKTIFLVGYMGCGKTTIGLALSKKLNMCFYDLDLYIENKFHKSISELFTEIGENAFRKIEQNVLHEISEFEECIISTGGGTACFFNNMDVMNKKGTTIYLKTSLEELTERLYYKDSKRPLLKGKNREELSHFIGETLKQREPFYMQSNFTVNADNSESAIDFIIKLLKNKKEETF